MNLDPYNDLDMTKVMFGQHAIHIPAWLVAQDSGIIVGATKSPSIRYGSDKSHVLIIGELIVRPHIAIASNNFQGYGVSGFLTSLPLASEWLRNGDVLVNMTQGMDELKRWNY